MRSASLEGPRDGIAAANGRKNDGDRRDTRLVVVDVRHQKLLQALCCVSGSWC